MTARKDDLRLPPRTPAYVDREGGAAELRISPQTWDKWVDDGTLPPAAPGFPSSTPRWRWADVDARLAGRLQTHDQLAPPEEAKEDVDPFIARAASFRHGPTSKPKRRNSTAGRGP